MRRNKLNSKAWIRLLSLFLCLLMAFSAASLCACNNAEEEPTNNVTEAPTDDVIEEVATEVPLNENGLVNVLVFTEDVPKGTKVTTKNTKVLELPVTNVPRNVVTDINEIKSMYTNKDFYSGDYVIASRLTKTKPVVLDESTIADKLTKTDNQFVIVTDFIKANTGEDIHGNLQTLIDKNPGRTIFFPDGEYVISRPLQTTSEPSLSTSFYFAGGAVLKASDNWKKEDMKNALICLGAKKKVNSIRDPGTNFYVMGGTFDGNGKADGISIDAGRETLIKDVVIVNTRYGIHIKEGTNSNSSDSDIDDVTIIGNGTPNSIGVYVVGNDNTISNARISNVATGIKAGNCTLMNSCTIDNTAGLVNTVAFETGGSAWVSNCVSINYDVGFSGAGARGFFKQCSAKWTVDLENSVEHTAFKSTGKLKASIIACTAEFLASDQTDNYFLRASSGGAGRVVSPVFDSILVCSADATAKYLESGSSIILPFANKKED